MLVQKTVTTNTNFAGRLSEGMLRKTARDGKRHRAKSLENFAIREIKNLNPNWGESECQPRIYTDERG